MKIDLPHGLFVEVGENSFDLFALIKDKKTPKALGYYTRFESVIKKATQYLISQNQDTVGVIEFLKKWSAIQSELAEYLSEYLHKN